MKKAPESIHIRFAFCQKGLFQARHLHNMLV
jgi:hypothetical protein